MDISGTFSSDTDGAIFRIVLAAGDPIPEPSSALFGLLIAAGLLRRRRLA